jgi:hypothetical protein
MPLCNSMRALGVRCLCLLRMFAGVDGTGINYSLVRLSESSPQKAG